MSLVDMPHPFKVFIAVLCSDCLARYDLYQNIARCILDDPVGKVRYCYNSHHPLLYSHEGTRNIDDGVEWYNQSDELSY